MRFTFVAEFLRTVQYCNIAETLERLKEAEFAGDVGEIVSISGILGKYWVVNGVGQAYKWEVDTSVKFKPDKENDKIPQRFTKCYRGLSFRVQSIVRPELTKTRLMTEEPKSYEPINF